MFVPPPKLWSKKQRYLKAGVNTELSDEEVKEKNAQIQFNNKLCVDKKAYFFGYVYPSLKKEYDKHRKVYQSISKTMYKMSLSDLMIKPNKTKEEIYFISDFYRKMPVIRNDCTMNLLTYYIENVEFENKWDKTRRYDFDYKLLMTPYFIADDSKLFKKVCNAILEAYKTLNYRMRLLKEHGDFEQDLEYIDEMEKNIFINTQIELYNRLIELHSNSDELSNYVIKAFYEKFDSHSKAWMWGMFGKEIVSHLKARASVVHIPTENESGKEYLGKNYILERVYL